jgi:hypothetical protein
MVGRASLLSFIWQESLTSESPRKTGCAGQTGESDSGEELSASQCHAQTILLQTNQTVDNAGRSRA